MHMVHVCLDTTATCAFGRMIYSHDTAAISVCVYVCVCWGGGKGVVGEGREKVTKDLHSEHIAGLHCRHLKKEP